MTKKAQRVYTRYTLKALEVCASLIKKHRITRKITMNELAERAMISRGLLRRIEQADPSCSIGVVFEVASILGIELFESDLDKLSSTHHTLQEQLKLLPKKSRIKNPEIDDDF